MAEMTALEFLKCKDRICRTYACNVCPIWRSRPDQAEGCGIFLRKYPEKAISIVKKWSAEHPQKTILQDFLEKYPKALIEDGAFPAACPFQLGYETESEKDINAYCESTARDSCRRCWNRPLEEVENNG